MALTFSVGVGHCGAEKMRNKPLRIHAAALGGYTLEGPYFRRSPVREALNRFFYWLGA